MEHLQQLAPAAAAALFPSAGTGSAQNLLVSQRWRRMCGSKFQQQLCPSVAFSWCFLMFPSVLSVFFLYKSIWRRATKGTNLLLHFVLLSLFNFLSRPLGPSRMVYTLSPAEFLHAGKPESPAEIRRKQRGCRAGREEEATSHM